MISSKRPIVVYIEQARIPDETTSITRSEVPITGDIVVHHRIQNGANNKAILRIYGGPAKPMTCSTLRCPTSFMMSS